MLSTPLRFRPKPPPAPPPIATCLNCGAEVASKFCPDCGQENEPLRLGIGYIFRDALEEFVKFDSKLVATLQPLFLRPGHLTREWSSGRRVRYISPFKLYLTATFLFFFVTSFRVDHRPVSPSKARVKKDLVSVGDQEKLDQAPPFVQHIVRAAEKIDSAEDTDEKAVQHLMLDNIPKALFVLLPLFALALKLVYIRSGRFYVEHLVFALHNHAFYFMVLTGVTFLPGSMGDVGGFFWCAVYSVLALKRNYAQGWIKTLFKGWMLGCGYSILLMFAMIGAFFLGAMNMPDPPPKPKQAGATETPKKDSASEPKPKAAKKAAANP
ncbi:MAG: DUF3667 domain-containing protein [Fimbriimonas sp.]